MLIPLPTHAPGSLVKYRLGIGSRANTSSDLTISNSEPAVALISFEKTPAMHVATRSSGSLAIRKSTTASLILSEKSFVIFTNSVTKFFLTLMSVSALAVSCW